MLLTCGVEKTLESPLDSKENQPINPKGYQPWIFTGKADAKAEAPRLWPPVVKSQLIGKDPDAGKDWRQENKGMTEDEMVGRPHPLDGHEFELVMDREAWRAVVQGVRHDWVTEPQHVFNSLFILLLSSHCSWASRRFYHLTQDASWFFPTVSLAFSFLRLLLSFHFTSAFQVTKSCCYCLLYCFLFLEGLSLMTFTVLGVEFRGSRANCLR